MSNNSESKAFCLTPRSEKAFQTLPPSRVLDQIQGDEEVYGNERKVVIRRIRAFIREFSSNGASGEVPEVKNLELALTWEKGTDSYEYSGNGRPARTSQETAKLIVECWGADLESGEVNRMKEHLGIALEEKHEGLKRGLAGLRRKV